MKLKLGLIPAFVGMTLALCSGSFSYAAEPLKVVASQVFYADIVREIGKEKVDVKSVASPKFNIHFIQPKPSDVRNISRADLVVYTGLDLEEWWPPLVEAAGRPEFFPGREKSLDLSERIHLLEVPDRALTRAEGDIHLYGNPHYILNPENAKVMASTIRRKLSEMDPANDSFYQANEKYFLARLDQKISQWKALSAHCAGKEIISYHKDIEYLTEFLGIRSEHHLEPKPGVPPTPKQIQFLEKYVKEKGIKVVLLPTYLPRDAANDLSKKTGVKVVIICQNAGELPGTESVIGLFDYNFKQISESLK